MLCTDTSNYNIFGNNFPSKSFREVAVDGGFAQTFVKNIGLVHYMVAYPTSFQCTTNLSGCVINGVVYGDTTFALNYTISGQILFQDNNQPVTNGIVKALKYDALSNQIITVDSTNIQSNGAYNLVHIPHDSIYIMAFENDEAQLQFVPTYYPSSTTWQNATVLYPSGNLSNINVLVYRINNSGGQYHVGGHIYINSQLPLSGLSNAIVYAKSGNNYEGYSISNSSGVYQVDSLGSGSYNMVADRIGYAPASRTTGITNYSKDTIDITMNSVLGIQRIDVILPKDFHLGLNYPNPFNPSTNISFDLPRNSHVELTIYNTLGQIVAVLVNSNLTAGSYKADWNGTNYASGVYFYRLTAGSFVDVKKMVLLK